MLHFVATAADMIVSVRQHVAIHVRSRHKVSHGWGQATLVRDPLPGRAWRNQDGASKGPSTLRAKWYGGSASTAI